MSVSPGNVAAVLQDLGRGLKGIQDRQSEYEKREEYYRGERREVITHPKLQKLLDKYGDAFRLNYAAVPCDALMDRVDLMSLTTGNEQADQLLRDRVWIPNSLDDDSDDIHLHASYLGDYYLVAEAIEVGDVADAEGESSTGAGTIELTPKHPSNMIVIYQRTNSRIPDFAVQMIQGTGKGEWDALVYYDDETWAFSAKDAGNGFDATKYQVDVDLDDDGVPEAIFNEFGFPVFHFRPDRKPYGLPVNAKMYGPQDAITKINATQMASMDFYGFPQRYATMDPAAEDDDDIDDDFNDDGTLDGNGNVDNPVGSSKLSSDPGGMWLLKGVRSAGSFQPADPKGFLDPLTFQIRAGATLTRTPLYEFDLSGSGDQPSGEARRRADGPIIKHAAKIKGQFGAVWGQVGAYALAALGVRDGLRVEAVWAPSETATDQEGISLVALKIENGIPPRQALLEAGYTQAQVDGFLPVDEANGILVPLSIDAVGKLSVALRDLGSAKQLGAVTDEQIRRVFRQWFGDIAGVEGDGQQPAADGSGLDVGVQAAAILKAKADAMGVLIRAGVDQNDAAEQVGLAGLDFSSIPTTVRLPADQASDFVKTGPTQ